MTPPPRVFRFGLGTGERRKYAARRPSSRGGLPSAIVAEDAVHVHVQQASRQELHEHPLLTWHRGSAPGPITGTDGLGFKPASFWSGSGSLHLPKTLLLLTGYSMRYTYNEILLSPCMVLRPNNGSSVGSRNLALEHMESSSETSTSKLAFGASWT